MAPSGAALDALRETAVHANAEAVSLAIKHAEFRKRHAIEKEPSATNWYRAAELEDEFFTRAQARLIEACSPETILAILDHVAALSTRLAVAGEERDAAIRTAFLSGVEHVAGPDGCGAREGEAAREYAARRSPKTREARNV